MPRLTDIHLDVETTWDRSLTVLGFHSTETGVVQLVGNEITRLRVVRNLPKAGRLFTFNGHSFDLTVINSQLGLNLRERFDSIDLRWSCYYAGMTGGQKAIERRMRFRRMDEEGDGHLAMHLWKRYESGDASALKRLLSYNREDLDGIRHIKEQLGRRGQL